MRSVRPLGTYQAMPTLLHRVDARVKLLALLAWGIAAFLVAPGPGLALATLAACAAAILARFSPASLLRALRPALIILVLALLANALRVDGTGDIALIGPLTLSGAGLARGATAVLRVVIVVALVLAVAATTTTQQVVDAITWAFKPLLRRTPAASALTMIVSVALRFLPEVASEFDRIESAQRARGARFDGGPIRRLKAYVAVLVPLVDALFRRSDDLAQALRMRCNVSGRLTDMTRPLGARELVLMVLSVALAALMVCL